MKWLRYFIFLLLSFIFIQCIRQYFFCPQYVFQVSPPFHGDTWYNPYDSISEQNWIKCNFHAHTNAWYGWTNGKGNSVDMHQAYSRYGYDVHAISEYEKINLDTTHNPTLVPAYEHGYNLLKTHQLVIHAQHVTWLDYLLPQTLSNKQRILDLLSATPDAAVIINHPGMKNGYRPEEIKVLTNYHGIEVLNPAITSDDIWDTALSSGHAVFVTGNDDIHNVFDDDLIGKSCTWLNVKSKNIDEIVHALKSGRGYAMKMYKPVDESVPDKVERLKHLPLLRSLTIHQDTLIVQWNVVAAKMNFIGQAGLIKDSVIQDSIGRYLLKPGDHYIRTHVLFQDNTEAYLNPVYRYDDHPLPVNTPSRINQTKSGIYVSLGILIILGWIWIWIRILFLKST